MPAQENLLNQTPKTYENDEQELYNDLQLRQPRPTEQTRRIRQEKAYTYLYETVWNKFYQQALNRQSGNQINNVVGELEIVCQDILQNLMADAIISKFPSAKFAFSGQKNSIRNYFLMACWGRLMDYFRQNPPMQLFNDESETDEDDVVKKHENNPKVEAISLSELTYEEVLKNATEDCQKQLNNNDQVLLYQKITQVLSSKPIKNLIAS